MLLPVFGVAQGVPLSHALLVSAIVAAFAITGSLLDERRRVLASAVVALGLLTCSAILVHFSEGLIEAHFHFFVMVVALTSTRSPARGRYVGLHHGVLGVLSPETVYNHPDAQAHPWRWAFVHAGFIAAAGLSAVATWRMNEDVREEKERALARAREAERALTASAAELARSNRDLEQFASVASHDRVEPLPTVTGFLELLDQRATGLDERSREYLRYALGGTEQMQALVGDLLDYAQAGRDVRGDATQLRQVLQNLISNAVKFAQPGVPPRVRVSATTSPGGGVDVAVADNGVGIPRAKAEEVVTMFERLGAVNGAAGSGMGLAIWRAHRRTPRRAHLGRAERRRRQRLPLHAAALSASAAAARPGRRPSR